MVEKFKLDDKLLEKYGTGYVPDRRYNERYDEQGLNCPYEHCIETMPLHEEEKKEAVKRGMLVDLREDPAFSIMDKKRIMQIPQEEPELYREIRKILDKKGIKDNECWFMPDLNSYFREFRDAPNSCRLYGHQCPGGKKQVDECASKGMFY